MSDPLSIYLNDHLAGAKFAIELLEGLRNKHHESSLGKFAAKMLDEVTADRTLLQKLRDDVDGGSNVLKEAGAWLTERTAQLKLRLSGEPELGDFETLEFLSIGIIGKLKLWTALSEIVPFDSRVNGLDFQRLIQRAQLQHDQVEAYRLAAAKTTLNRSFSGSAAGFHNTSSH